jgi:flagellar motor switch protein FliG
MDERRRAAGAYRKTQGLIKTTGTSARPESDDISTGKPPRGGRSQRDDASREPRDPRHEERLPPGSPAANRPCGEGGPQLPPGKPLREVAQFLTLVGRDQAAAVLRNMPREQADRIVDVMAHLDPISPGEARRILVQFGARQNAVDHEVAGGPETAREILVRAFGQEDGERRFYELLPDERPRRFGFLADADGRQLSLLLRGEAPATVAIVAANAPQEAAARLLQALPEEDRPQVVRRMATLQKVDSSVIAAVEQTLRSRMESIERPSTDEIDGEQRLAEILRYLDVSTSETILGDLTVAAPDSAEHIRRRMTTLEDVLLLRARDLQEVLKRVDDLDLAVILKGKPPQLEARIMENVSQRRAEMVRMHRDSLGPMRRRDVDRITGEFIEMIRSMASAGEIVIQRSGEEFI